MREKFQAVVSSLEVSLPWRVVLLLAVAAVATVAFVEVAEEVIGGNADPIDRAISLAIHDVDSPALDHVMIFVTSLGAGVTLAIAVALLAAYCLYRKERRLAFVLVANAVAQHAVNLLLKHSFARPRPTLFDEITRPESFSFPSGHSMSSMVIYGTIATVLVLLRPGLRSLVVPMSALLIVAIGFSRVYLGVHWAFDVLAGFAAGIPFVLAAIHLARRATRPEPNI